MRSIPPWLWVAEWIRCLLRQRVLGYSVRPLRGRRKNVQSGGHFSARAWPGSARPWSRLSVASRQLESGCLRFVQELLEDSQRRPKVFRDRRQLPQNRLDRGVEPPERRDQFLAVGTGVIPQAQ